MPFGMKTKNEAELRTCIMCVALCKEMRFPPNEIECNSFLVVITGDVRSDIFGIIGKTW